MSSTSTEMKDLNHYDVLCVQRNATSAQITSAYRKQALKCHPDKNPDNVSAAKSFHTLSDSFAILTDVASRAEFDKVLDNRIAVSLRNKRLDNDRRRFKGELDAREMAASSAAEQRKRESEKQRQRFKDELAARERAALYAAEQRKLVAEELKREIDRLKQEGLLFRAEQERLAQGLKDCSITSESNEIDLDFSLILRLKWRANKTDSENGGYSADIIKDLFSHYGKISDVVVSGKKNGNAIVEYTTESAVLRALRLERGLVSNPLSVSRLSTPVEVASTLTSNSPTVKTTLQSKAEDIVNVFRKLKL